MRGRDLGLSGGVGSVGVAAHQLPGNLFCPCPVVPHCIALPIFTHAPYKGVDVPCTGVKAEVGHL